MIIGLGIDIAEVARIRSSIERFGERFLSRIYTDAERDYCSRRANAVESFAARFAAKEAVMKALGTGWGEGVAWRDVEVVRGTTGKPMVRLHGSALELSRRLGISRFELSLSHTRELAIAQVLAEGDRPG